MATVPMSAVGEEMTLVGRVERDTEMIDSITVRAVAKPGTLMLVNGKGVEVGQMDGRGVDRMAPGTGKMAQRG